MDTLTMTQSDAARSPARKIGSNWTSRVFLLPVLLFLAVFFVGPVLMNVMESVKAPGVPGPSLANYTRILGDGYYLDVIWETMLLGVVVTILSLALGYPVARAIAKSKGALKAVLIFALVAPLLVNVVVRSYGWMVILGGNGVINSLLHMLGLPGVELIYTWLGITIALVHVLLPFMVLAIASNLESMDASLEDAAAVLGASGFRVFRYVTLPLSMEGVITGSIITFTLTIGSFVTVMLLGNNKTMVLPLLIYQRLTVMSDWPSAATLGIILLIVVTCVLWLQLRLRNTTSRALV